MIEPDGIEVEEEEEFLVEELCPICQHDADDHDELGCTVPGCGCEGP